MSQTRSCSITLRVNRSANTWDTQAAAHFGFQVARIDRFGLLDDRIPGRPRLMLRSLTDLPDAIDYPAAALWRS